MAHAAAVINVHWKWQVAISCTVQGTTHWIMIFPQIWKGRGKLTMFIWWERESVEIYNHHQSSSSARSHRPCEFLWSHEGFPCTCESGTRPAYRSFNTSIINKWLFCHITHLASPDADVECAGMSFREELCALRVNYHRFWQEIWNGACHFPHHYVRQSSSFTVPFNRYHLSTACSFFPSFSSLMLHGRLHTWTDAANWSLFKCPFPLHLCVSTPVTCFHLHST